MIKGKKTPKLLEKKQIVEAVANIPPIATTGVSAWLTYRSYRWTGIGLAIAALWLVVSWVMKFFNARAQDQEKRNEVSYDGFEGAIYALYATLSAHLKIPPGDDGKLRITMKRVVFPSNDEHEPEYLEQMLPYIGGKGGDAGRRFSIRSGLSGRVALGGQPLVAKRKGNGPDGFIKEMTNNWHYTEREAKALTQDRQSWMAIPIIGSNKKVIAVVYLDSNERELFSPLVQKIAINACNGVALYIKERYKS